MSSLKVGIPLYNNFDSLDVLGPFQTFTWAEMEGHLVGATMKPVKSFEGVSILPDRSFKNCPKLDVLFVPGGSDPVEDVLLKGHLGNNAYLDFLVRQARGAKLVCSVCSGALLLGGAGLLDGHTATTHWAYKEVLRLFRCQVVDDYRRYVQSENRITGAGISSGLDLAMYIVSLLYGVKTARQGQLGMQYNPQPAFHCGDPADLDIKDDPGMVAEMMKFMGVEQARLSVVKWLGNQK
jgi:cyclohexyl-isocyanide hydratase